MVVRRFEWVVAKRGGLSYQGNVQTGSRTSVFHAHALPRILGGFCVGWSDFLRSLATRPRAASQEIWSPARTRTPRLLTANARAVPRQCGARAQDHRTSALDHAECVWIARHARDLEAATSNLKLSLQHLGVVLAVARSIGVELNALRHSKRSQCRCRVGLRFSSDGQHRGARLVLQGAGN